MNAYRLITFAMLAALALASAAAAQDRESWRERRDRDRDRGGISGSSSFASTQPAPPGYLDRYAILEQRNLFVRDRSRPTSRPVSSSSTQPTRRSPEESLVLRGIAMEEIGYRAYLEDLNTGATLRVSPGDPLGRGAVTAVALDAIAFEYNGRQSWIEIGSDLTGRPSSAASSSSMLGAASGTGGGATTAPATLPADIDLNDPSLTIEQRMRLRAQLQRQGR